MFMCVMIILQSIIQSDSVAHWSGLLKVIFKKSKLSNSFDHFIGNKDYSKITINVYIYVIANIIKGSYVLCIQSNSLHWSMRSSNVVSDCAVCSRHWQKTMWFYYVINSIGMWSYRWQTYIYCLHACCMGLWPCCLTVCNKLILWIKTWWWKLSCMKLQLWFIEPQKRC